MLIHSPLRSLAVFALLLSGLAVGRADVKLPAIFGDHMVLQEKAKLPVWGTADAGEKVSVSFAGRTGRAVAAIDGTWRVDLPPVHSSDKGQVLTVAGKNTLTFQDVLVGEVWVASGQSNMQFGINGDSRSADTIAHANDPELRLFVVPMATSLDPKTDIAAVPADNKSGKWQVCTPELLGATTGALPFSAVGYYFAREIRSATGKPVGMIGTYVGGTSAQAWTSLSGLGKDPVLAQYITEHQKAVDDYPAALAAYPQKLAAYQAAMKAWAASDAGKAFNATMAQWSTAAAQAKTSGQPPPPRPQLPVTFPHPPTTPDGGNRVPSSLYNAMIAPLIPYAIKGAIWYQGESNGGKVDGAVEYAVLFSRMITDWREKWSEGDFPFLFVSLANYKAPAQTPSEGVWPWLRESQLKTLSLTNTGMALAIDIGDAKTIHPLDKLDVGLRLALAARHIAYGEELVYSGPIYRSMTVEGNKIRLTFKNRGGGLIISAPPAPPTGTPPATPTELTGFGIAGDDQKFVWAKAVIDGDTVVVSSDQVPAPAAVRYDWADNPAGDLYNKKGLPASPFRTDNWTPSVPAPAPAPAPAK